MTAEKGLNKMEVLDEDSFEKLFRSFFPPLMVFAKKMLVDEDDAREVVHLVFISVWEKRKEIDLSTFPQILPLYLGAQPQSECHPRPEEIFVCRGARCGW